MDGLPGPYAFPTVPEALYDLTEDPAETTDVSRIHPEVVARLDALAQEARRALGDRLRGLRGEEVRSPGRRAFQRGEQVRHLARGAGCTLSAPPDPLYPGTGAATLVDGLLGTRDHHDGNWLGFRGDDLEAELHLPSTTEVARVSVDCLSNQGAWIFLPREVQVWASGDGEEWMEWGRTEVDVSRDPELAAIRIRVEGKVSRGSPAASPPGVRYLRVRATNYGLLPSWHPGAGEEAWLFVDEIVVE